MSIERQKEASLIHRGLGRVEFFDLTDAEIEDLQATLEVMAGEGRGRFSFHAPVMRPHYFPHSGVTCYFLSEDPDRRELSFRLLEHTLQQAGQWGADYVVTHLTFGPTDTTDEQQAMQLATDTCRHIAGMSRDTGVPVDIEFAGYSDAFNRAELFTGMVEEHPELGICIDIGHTFVSALKRGRDYLDDIACLAPQARSMHLWNSLGEEHTRRYHHTPLHPSQQPGHGWIDVEQALQLTLGENPQVNIIFEYPVNEVTEEIQAGYDWVSRLVSRLR